MASTDGVKISLIPHGHNQAPPRRHGRPRAPKLRIEGRWAFRVSRGFFLGLVRRSRIKIAAACKKIAVGNRKRVKKVMKGLIDGAAALDASHSFRMMHNFLAAPLLPAAIATSGRPM